MTEKSTILTEYGEYIPLVERQPKFDEKFPMHDGWRIEIERVDPLTLRPALMELYRECIRNKRSAPSLPSLDDPFWRAVLFIARLVKDDKVYREASTLKAIYEFKDYEIGETNARQRLVSVCGFPGGGPTEYDEEVRPVWDATEGLLPEPPMQGLADVEDEEPEPDPIPEDEEVRTSEPIPLPETNSDIPAHIQAQVDAFAAVLQQQGKEFDLPSTKKEALKFLRQRQVASGVSS
jgi:hypothetical protein